MKTHLTLLIILFVLSSCVMTKKTEPVLTWSDLMGKKVICQAPGGPARVFFFSPHLIGIWSTDTKYIIEYFRTLYVDEEKKVYLESVLKGESSLKSDWLQPGTPENRRIIAEIKDGLINLVVGHGIDEARQMIKPKELNCFPDGPITNFFSPDHQRK